MSYSIIYDKQFVVIPQEGKANLYIPMTLAGSSNTWEDNSRRARDWTNFKYLTDCQLTATKEDMLTQANALREEHIANPEYSDSEFGYYEAIAIGSQSTHSTTFGMFKGIVTTGCKKALTIEQLAEDRVFINITNMPAYGNIETQQKYKDLHLTSRGYDIMPKTTEEFHTQLAEMTASMKENGITGMIVSFVGMYESMPKRLRKKFFPISRSLNKVYAEEGYYVLSLEGEIKGYFKKFTKYGFQYNYHAPFRGSKATYTTKAKANVRAKSINKKISRNNKVIVEFVPTK